MEKQIRFKTIKLITFLEIIIVVTFVLLTLLLGYENGKYAFMQEANYLEEKVTESDNNIKNSIITISEVSHSILTNEDTTLLKSYYYDRIGDNYGKSVALANLRKEVVTLSSFYSLIDAVALKIYPSEEYQYSNIYSFDENGQIRNDFEDIISQYTFNSGIEKNIKFYNGYLYYFYCPNRSDNSLICIRFSQDELIDSFLISKLNKKNSYVLLNNDGSYNLVCSNFDVSNEEVEKYLQPSESSNTSFSRIIIKREVCYSVPLLIITNNDFLNERDFNIIFLIILCFLIIIVGSLYLFFTLKFMNRPVKNIINAMNDVGNGKMNVKITEKTKGDLQIINDGFNNMMDSLNEYVNENYVYQMKIVESDFKALQAQINPHFLYNCFANISSLCKLNEVEKAQEFTAKLSIFFLYITKNKEPLVHLKDEYNHTLLYLDIQKIRFNNRVNIETEKLDEEIESIIVPKLVIQPIVENAYKHVFSNIIDNGMLKIKIKNDVNFISIIIEDNGSITQDEINKLNDNMINGDANKTGLYNVKKRLNFYSGNKADLILEKSDLGGLRVILLLPKGEEK